MLRWQRYVVPVKAAVRSSADNQARHVSRKNLPSAKTGRFLTLCYWLGLFVSLDIKELAYIDDHPAATLYRREVTIPFFDPVLGENELATLRLKGFGVTRNRKYLPAAKGGRFLLFLDTYSFALSAFTLRSSRTSIIIPLPLCTVGR